MPIIVFFIIKCQGKVFGESLLHCEVTYLTKPWKPRVYGRRYSCTFKLINYGLKEIENNKLSH